VVPLLDILNHDQNADVTVRVKSASLDFISDTALVSGQQIWNNYGSKTNEELLMCYGFALEGNQSDSIVVPLLPNANDGEAPSTGVRLSTDGIPDEVINSIESEEDGSLFASLIRSLIHHRKSLQECLQQLSSALDKKSCKGWLAKARRRNLEIFLQGQSNIMQAGDRS